MQESLLKEHMFSQWKQQFGENEGLWRCKGRLSEAGITEFAKYPILLDASHHITALIVKSCHEKVLHDEGYIDGIEIMVWGKAKGEKVAALLCNLIVDRFSLHHVLHCLDSESKNLNHLQYTGVGFAGPLYIVNDPDTKVWICLYTCYVTRVVHLDIVPNLTTDALIFVKLQKILSKTRFPLPNDFR